MKNLLKKQILIPVGVLLVLVAITLWSLKVADGVNPIDEDGKKAQQEIDKREKEDRKENKEKLGKDLPSKEEVERYMRTVGLDKNPIVELEKEYGKEVADLYLTDRLISTYTEGEDRVIAEGRVKRESNEGSLPTEMDLTKDGEEFEMSGVHVTADEGFTEVGGGYRVGYSFMMPDLESEIAYGNSGALVYGIFLNAYSLDEMTTKEFQEGFEKMSVQVEGVKAEPGIHYLREYGNIKEYLSESEIEKTKDIRSLWMYGRWGELGDFNKTLMYPGTVTSMMYQVDIKKIFPTAKVTEEGEVTGVPNELTVTVNGEPFQLLLREGRNVIPVRK